jgi:hypothetical protein
MPNGVADYGSLSFDPRRGAKGFLTFLEDAKDACKNIPRRPLEEVIGTSMVQVGVLRGAVVTVTPPMALELLIKHNVRNRKVSYSHALKIADEIAHGRWTLTHQGGGFNKRGDLEDGQHRLGGVVIAGQPIQMLIVVDLEDDLFKKIDSGKLRSVASSFQLAGHNGQSPVLGTTIKTLAIPYDEGAMADYHEKGVRWVGTPEALDYLMEHPTLEDAAHEVFEVHEGAIDALGDKSVAVMAFWRIREDWGQEVADAFFEQLADDTLPSSHPVSVLQARIAKHKLCKLAGKMDAKRKQILRPHQILWLTAAAFKAVRKGQRTIGRLDPRADDKFPRFEDSSAPAEPETAAA